MKYLIIIISFTLLLPSFVRAQVYTFDFLTYSDQSHESQFPIKRWKIAGYIFKGLNEFDKNSNANEKEYTPYSVWYLYFSYRLYNGEYMKINAAFQGWATFSKQELGFDAGWGTPLLWANIKLPVSTPLWLRIGYKFGKTGSSFGVEDNQLDIGLSFGRQFGSLALEFSASYRIRGRAIKKGIIPSVHWVPIGETTGLFDQPGNEIHYKFEPSKKIAQNTQLSMFVMGYHSGNKKYQGKIIADSESFKTAFGTSFAFRSKTKKIFILSFLWDFWGRYDKKGFAIVFNVAK